MQRVEIYLGEAAMAQLAAASSRTGASRSELIRRAVRSEYGGSTPEQRLAALRASAGSWSDHTETGSDYVDGLRRSLPDGASHTVAG